MLASLRNKRSQAKNKRSTLKDRKKDVESIISSLGKNFDDDVRDINNHVISCTENLNSGLKGVKIITTTAEHIRDDKEKDAAYDPNLSMCSGNLSKEVARCKTEIGRLDTEISNLDVQIQAEQDRKRKEALEALGDAVSVVTNFF